VTDNRFGLTGKVAIVTGASSGLGAHFARVLAQAGAAVALCARRVERLQALAAELGDAGHTAMAVALDVRDADTVAAALSQVETALGVPDILVNNAGTAQPQRFLELTDEAWRRIHDVNLDGVFRVGQATARAMARAGRGGAIVNIASLLGQVVQPTQAAYASSKAAVIHLTKAMALELARERIRVNALAPGYFVTEMNQAFFATAEGAALAGRLLPRRVGQLHELDGALLLLVSDAGSYITGATIPVDGGTRLKGV
jgi:NAD(P)-dependent dehydrogenase (short-subunit alcohol dehydrogenase family)